MRIDKGLAVFPKEGHETTNVIDYGSTLTGEALQEFMAEVMKPPERPFSIFVGAMVGDIKHPEKGEWRQFCRICFQKDGKNIAELEDGSQWICRGEIRMGSFHITLFENWEG